MAGFPTAAAHLQLGRAVTGIAPSGLSRAPSRREVLFEQNRQRTTPEPRPLPRRCVPSTVAHVRRRSYKRPNYFSRSRPDRRAVAAAQHGRRALRTLAGEPGRHGHRRARAGLRGGLQASASECAPAVCTLAAVGGHSLSAAPLAVRRRWQGECCDEAGGGEGRHDGDGGAEHPQREAEGPRGRGPGGATPAGSGS